MTDVMSKEEACVPTSRMGEDVEKELVLEGTWEEILARSQDFAGRRVRLTVLPAELAVNDKGAAKPQPENTPNSTLLAANQRMLAVLDELERNPWSPEEMKVLDNFEQFQKDYPVSLAWWPKDES